MVLGGHASAPVHVSNQPCGASASSPGDGVQHPDTPAMHKLRKAAQEFESMLIDSWWRSMKDSAFGESDDDSGPTGIMSDMGTQAMSQAISSVGGLGLANMVVRDLQPKIDVSGCPAGTAGAARDRDRPVGQSTHPGSITYSKI